MLEGGERFSPFTNDRHNSGRETGRPLGWLGRGGGVVLWEASMKQVYGTDKADCTPLRQAHKKDYELLGTKVVL